MKKRGMLAVLLAGMMLLLGGCGMSAEDAGSYAKSVLDASYKGEFKEYLEWTKSTEEEARATYEGNVDTMLEEAGYLGLGLSEELLANYRQVYLDMAKLAKYEVGEVKEAGDDVFTVEVTAEPFVGFDGINEEVTALLTAEVSNMAEIPGDEELNQMFYQKIYDLMAEKLQNPAYGEAQTVTLHVQADSDGVYYIPQEELTALDAVLFPADNL